MRQACRGQQGRLAAHRSGCNGCVENRAKFPLASLVQKLLYRLPNFGVALFVSAMPPSSLEDRVRLLCAQAVAAKTDAEINAVLPQLRAAIQDHVRYLRAIAVEVIPEVFGSESQSRLGALTKGDCRRPRYGNRFTISQDLLSTLAK